MMATAFRWLILIVADVYKRQGKLSSKEGRKTLPDLFWILFTATRRNVLKFLVKLLLRYAKRKHHYNFWERSRTVEIKWRRKEDGVPDREYKSERCIEWDLYDLAPVSYTHLVEYLTKCSYYTINGDQKHFKLFLKLWMFHVKHFLLLLLKNN